MKSLRGLTTAFLLVMGVGASACSSQQQGALAQAMAAPVPAAGWVESGSAIARGAKSVRLAAVGDIAASDDADAAVADLVASFDPRAVLLLGDVAYPSGRSKDFAAYFTPDWQRFSNRWLPVPGNHEYRTRNAAGYRAYFGESGALYWSRRVGKWLVIGLDSEKPGSSAQIKWLKATLRANDGVPTVVAWHRPRYSSGQHGDQPDIASMWKAASSDPDVRLVLNGHDHNYERMSVPVPGRAPLTVMVVGTGGGELRATPELGTRPWRNFYVDNLYGALDLRLKAKSFSWRFVDVAGDTLDSGSESL